MAERHDLIINITESGEVSVKVEGVSGPMCLKETEFIFDGDVEIISEEKTSEYFKSGDNDNVYISANGSKE